MACRGLDINGGAPYIVTPASFRSLLYTPFSRAISFDWSQRAQMLAVWVAGSRWRYIILRKRLANVKSWQLSLRMSRCYSMTALSLPHGARQGLNHIKSIVASPPLTFFVMSALMSNLGWSMFQPKPVASRCSSAYADAYHMSFFGTQPRMTQLS